MSRLLEVENLQVSFHTYAGEVKAVRGITFGVEKGETLAMVGESGCGKSVTAKALMRLFERTSGEIMPGSAISFDGVDVLGLNKKELHAFRGSEIGMIFQDPMTSLDPTMSVGKQVGECLMVHKGISMKEAVKQSVDLLRLVEIPNPEERVRAYPHQLSGGMRQRVVIATALACNPKLLIADEPTTALDVTIQAQVLDLLRGLKEKLGTAIILVTHDLGIVADFADRIQVMYAGVIVEEGTKQEIFKECDHPYTWALLQSIPSEDDSGRELYSLKGTPPDLLMEQKGCPFASRCEYCMPVCKEYAPEFTQKSGTHRVACWLQHEKAPKVRRPVGLGGEIR
ncbi:MAG: ABC transporter ATP-binding protein [Lachnospiraceae bacterium]|nr:ABC transporter ATP-binding protein [Lachnospiraceae bacterium]